MNPNRTEQPDRQDEPHLPPDLVRDLRALYPYPATPPTEVEHAVRNDAREQIGNLRRHRRWGFWGSIAASVGFVFIMQQVMRNSTMPEVRERVTSKQSPAPVVSKQRMAMSVADELDADINVNDIDGNGRVDILDAYVMARGLANEGTPPNPAWDINADGTIDQRDIDAVAQSAVRLKGGA